MGLASTSLTYSFKMWRIQCKPHDDDDDDDDWDDDDDVITHSNDHYVTGSFKVNDFGTNRKLVYATSY